MKKHDNGNIQHIGGQEKLLLVAAVVLIFCGGNGLGILIAAFLWKKLGNMLLSVLILIGITAVAFILAMLVVVVFLKSAKVSGSSAPIKEDANSTKGSDSL